MSTRSAGEVVFAWEPLAGLLDEPGILKLVRGYYDEYSSMPEVARFAPDWPRLRSLAQAGIFRVWTARSGVRLIGFIAFYVHPHLNYRSTLFGIEGGYFLDREFRSIWLAIRMWRGALAALAEIGVAIVLAHDDEHHPLGGLFRRLGFLPDGRLYSLRLK